MAKNKKKKRKKKFYSKKEFTNIFCSRCGLCDGDPTFCYNRIYKVAPHLFITEIHKAILEVKEWNQIGGVDWGMAPGHFRYAVCSKLSGHCQGDVKQAFACEHFETCFKEFEDQLKGLGGVRLSKRRLKKNKKKKAKQKFIVKAYPTAFMSNDENWKKAIERILSDGDNNREQNKIEAGSV